MGNFDDSIPFVIGNKVIRENNIEEVYSPYREIAGKDYKRGNIIMFGCSFAYGHLLEEPETFHYKLSHKLKRPVYNYASPGESTQFALMKIRSHTIDEIIKNSDYAILITIGEHIWRVNANSNGFPPEYTWPRYENKNNKLVFHKTTVPFIETSYLYKYIRKLFYAKILAPSSSENVQNYMFDNMKLHYMEIKRELESINPNIKVVIIPYLDTDKYKWFIFSEGWKELEEEGFIVIHIDNYLTNLRELEYVISETDGHPSGKAWTEITKLLCDDLKILK